MGNAKAESWKRLRGVLGRLDPGPLDADSLHEIARTVGLDGPFGTSGRPGPRRLEALYRVVTFLPRIGAAGLAERLVEHERTAEPAELWNVVLSAARLSSRRLLDSPVHAADLSSRSRRLPFWAGNVAVALATATCRRHELRDVLRSTAATRIPRGIHRGIRWSMLGVQAAQCSSLATAIRCLELAVRELDRDPALDAEFRAADTRTRLAYFLVDVGDLERADQLLREAESVVCHARSPDLSAQSDRVRARIQTRRGDVEDARMTLRRALRRLGPRRDAQPTTRTLTHLALVHVAANLGRSREGWFHWREARRWAASRSELQDGMFEHMRALLQAIPKSQRAYRTALESFDLAEKYFESAGDGHVLARSRVCFHRGHLHLRHGDLDAAAANALRCLELARARQCVPAQAAGLLLKSQILLQQSGKRVERFYEEVLRDLGAVRDPQLLFRIIANLYLYSWTLGEQLELTVHHFDQISAFRRILDQHSFQRLYRRYVVQPVLLHSQSASFGAHPLEIHE